MPYVTALLNMKHGITINGRIAAAAIASELVAAANLPSSVLSSPEVYYVNNFASKVSESICCFNDKAVIDVQGAIDLARKFWTMRYFAAYGGAPLIYDEKCCFFEIIGGASNFFSPEEIKFLNDYAKDILDFRHIVRQVCRDEKERLYPQIVNPEPVTTEASTAVAVSVNPVFESFKGGRL